MTEVEIIEKIHQLQEMVQTAEVKSEINRLLDMLEPVKQSTRDNAFLDECAG